MTSANISPDIIWAITRNNNSYLVSRNTNGKVQLSRDPLNLLNVNSRKYAGYVDPKAVGVAPGEKGGVSILKKNPNAPNKPAASSRKVPVSGSKTNRKTYKTLAGMTAKNGYRADLRAAAVARASAIRRSQKAQKPTPEKKLRGSKARQAEEE